LCTGKAPNWRCSACKHQWRGGLFAGGSGATLEAAVIICGITNSPVAIRVEKQWLTEKLGLDQDLAGEPSGWTIELQALLEVNHGFYDRLTIRLPDGTKKVVYFDITCLAKK